MLIAGRVIQGIGGGGLIILGKPCSRIVISRLGRYLVLQDISEESPVVLLQLS